MSRFLSHSLCAVLLLAVSAYSQTLPCKPGTMADVLGTSCSVGPLIFNFQPTFPEFFTGPEEIGFLPIQEQDRVGFRLITNFEDRSTPNTTFHFVEFGYTVQAAPGFEIRKQGLNMDASVQSGSSDSDSALAEVTDFQNYPNTGFVPTQTALESMNGSLITEPPNFNKLSDARFMEVPEFQGILLPPGESTFGDGLTTAILTSTNGSAVSILNSADFLYTFGPVVPAPPLAALNYTNIDLPGAVETSVSNISNSGTKVGSYLGPFGGFHGYVQDPDGIVTTIDVPGASDTFADGLNERGDVVGSYINLLGKTHGFLLRDGLFITIDVPNARFTIPITINDQGQIVGEYRSADLGIHGFLLDGDVLTTINHGPGVGRSARTVANAINNSGLIVGSFFDPFTFRGFEQKRDSEESIDVPGQGETFIEGVNNRGAQVGGYSDINFVAHGFVSAGGVFQTMDFPGGNNSSGLGINGAGMIVGVYNDSDGVTHSFLAVPRSDGDGRDSSESSVDRASLTSNAPKRQELPDCVDEDSQRQKLQLRTFHGCKSKQ